MNDAAFLLTVQQLTGACAKIHLQLALQWSVITYTIENRFGDPIIIKYILDDMVISLAVRTQLLYE